MRARTLSIDTHGFIFAVKFVSIVCISLGILWTGSTMVFGKSVDASLDSVALIEQATQDPAVLEAIEILHNEGAKKSSVYGSFAESVRAPAVADYIPKSGMFLGVDLTQDLLTVYSDGLAVQTMPIEHKPRQESAESIATGLYVVEGLEREHYSQVTKEYLPDRIRIDDRHSIHGPPQQADGTELSDSQGGSIQLSSENAARLFDMVHEGVTLFVLSYNMPEAYGSLSGVEVAHDSLPAVSAKSFEITDTVTGKVYLEKNTDKRYPIASVTKLMTALVAHDVYGINEEITAPGGDVYVVGDLYYPLFLRSSNGVAHAIAAHGGTPAFLARMNTQARALGMYQTSFADSSGLSPKNISTAHDLTILGQYLYREKRFLLDISSTDSMTITSSGGKAWNMVNQNKFATDAHFRGGKLGFTDEAGQTSLALFTLPVGDEVRVISIVILNSHDWKQDTRTLIRWFTENASTVE